VNYSKQRDTKALQSFIYLLISGLNFNLNNDGILTVKISLCNK
jgi:hypothetical protein